MGLGGHRGSSLAPRHHQVPCAPAPSRIYKYQAHGYAFSSLEEMLRSLGGDAFINMTQRSVAESLLEVGVTQRFVDDVIAAVLRSSYGQSVLVPAFAGETGDSLSSPCDSSSQHPLHGQAVEPPSSSSPQEPCHWQGPRAAPGQWKEATSWCVRVC